jgi:hypothetical protein
MVQLDGLGSFTLARNGDEERGISKYREETLALVHRTNVPKAGFVSEKKSVKGRGYTQDIQASQP